MNNREKSSLCSLIARWELQAGGTTSETIQRGACIRDLRDLFAINDSDLVFYRAYQLGRIIDDRSDDALDRLISAVEADYEAVIDALDKGPAALRSHVKLPPLGGKGGKP